MPSQPAIPPVLSPNLSRIPPAGSLTVLTSVLASPTNWLLLRFLYTALKSGKSGSSGSRSLGEEEGEGKEEDPVRVILVSWLRVWEWWKQGGKKLGLDLSQSRTFRFIQAMGPVMLGMQQMEGMIEEAIKSFTNEEGGQKIVVFMDGVDFMMAALGLGAGEMLGMIGRIREQIHSLILTTSADSPLLHSPSSPLEINHAAFVVGLAHQARLVISLSGLETGAAKDVSGMLRVGKEGAEEQQGEEDDKIEEREVLYFVSGDGGVRVFERGA